MNNGNDRRKFLLTWLAIASGASGITVLSAGCSASKKRRSSSRPTSVAAAHPCEDLTGVDVVDVEKRKSLGYVSLSPIPDKECSNCKLWIPAKEGKACGGCLLFTGPVSTEGHCTYWAPRV